MVATDAFEWTFENTSELIGLYENFPHWNDVSIKDYKKPTDKRDKALAVLAVLLGTNE